MTATPDSNTIFEPPPADVDIWRFMDFTKFVACLEHGGLFFVRAHCLGDPFEGSYPEPHAAARRELFSGIPIAPEKLDGFLSDWSKALKWVRYWALINCWHINEHESAAMWKLYGGEKAIAIRSRYSLLRTCLDSSIDIGVVKYIDFASERIPEGHLLRPYWYKRKSFTHERELRAVCARWETQTKADEMLDTDHRPLDCGMWMNAKLDVLVTEVRVAPQSDSWVEELVRNVLARYGLDKPVVKSSLDEEPFF